MNGSLALEDFPRFFHELWGPDLDPFPWQARLVTEVSQHGWPSGLDLPTASGKTAVLDIAVFALALEADRPALERRAPLRTVYVIDRRVVVDQAFERASHIAARLREAGSGVLGTVADRLRSIQGRDDAPPLVASVLRGGMPRESDWARSPGQPCILVSTVDQVGSRLLFRGYGVTDSMRPVHAGLLGEDALYLLDEVHLSRPFAETLGAVKRFGRQAESVSVPWRLEVVPMSATPATREASTFALEEDDLVHPVLSPRLRASKRVRLRPVETPKEEGRARELLARACVQEAAAQFENPRSEVVAVIVNRVDTARRVARLADQENRRWRWEVHLMTGRMRPLDRNDLLRQLEPAVRAGRDRGAGSRLLVVSTQSIEAGADFDFDALVSECASLDALRQRFGRVDRLGRLGQSSGTIVAGTGQLTLDADQPAQDPIYGEALERTWAWLNVAAASAEDGSVDFGILAMQDLLGATPEGVLDRLLPPAVQAPVLLPAYLDLWSQTSPRPAVDPDVALFLHGPERSRADVQVVWRADLEPAWLEQAVDSKDWTDAVRDVVAVAPPSSLEAISVSIGAARAWLASVSSRADQVLEAVHPALADVEGESEEEATVAAIAPAVLWAGDATAVVAHPSAIRPGATLVVPASYGGMSARNWDPEGREPTTDRGDEAQLLQRGRAVIRWHGDVVASWAPGLAAPRVDDDALLETGAQAEREAFSNWADEVAEATLPEWTRVALRALKGRSRIVAVELPQNADQDNQEGGAAALPRRLRASLAARRVSRNDVRALRLSTRPAQDADPRPEAATEADGGAFAGVAVPLRDHLDRVRDYAAEFARSVGLNQDLVADVSLAASIHDIGKMDPRFQLMLHGGDRVRLEIADEPLAKSGIARGDRAARVRARIASGYPHGARHELLSVALAASADAILGRAADPDLVLHLVASHHGACRPFAPPVGDSESHPIRFSLDGIVVEGETRHGMANSGAGPSERFWRLQRRYGWWRLAWLEGILRLADHRASEHEEEIGRDN